MAIKMCPYCRKQDKVVQVTYGDCDSIYVECERCWVVIGEIAK